MHPVGARDHSAGSRERHVSVVPGTPERRLNRATGRERTTYEPGADLTTPHAAVLHPHRQHSMPVETSESKSECIRRMKTCLSKLETEAGRLKGAPS